MSLFVSTSCLNEYEDLFKVLDEYSNIGINKIEISGCHEYKSDFSKISEYRSDFIIHNYFPPASKSFVLNLASQDMEMLERSRSQIKKSIDFCHSMKIPLFTFHPGFLLDPEEWEDSEVEKEGNSRDFVFSRYKNVFSYEDAFITFVESVKEICGYAKKYGIKLACENAGSVSKNEFLMMKEYEEFERLFNAVDDDSFGMLLDLGHLKLSAIANNFKENKFIDRFRDKIREVHIHENNGIDDLHDRVISNGGCLEVISGNSFNDIPLVMETRGMTIDEIKEDYQLIKRSMG